MKISVADAELQILEESIVLVNVEGVEHVEVLLLGEDERISQKLLHLHCVCDVVVAVGDLEDLVGLVLQDGRGQVVERKEVLDLFRLLVFHYIGVYHSFSRDQEVLNLCFREVKVHLKSLQILIQERCDNLNITCLHWS